MVMAVVDGAPAPPALIVERVERRSRLSVAFRLLLVLPQLVVLYVLLLVGVVAVVVGWFAALVLGRLPEPIARYLCHLTRYTTRVYAYLCFLTDRYPPFEFTAAGYPVEVDLAPGRLNRLAVLFRLFLVIPASILSSLAFAGYLMVSFIIWLVVLVAGRVPSLLFDATTALLRYSMRTTAYTWLVTAAYPWGLFGDQPGPTGPSASPAPVTAPGEAVPDTATLASTPEGLQPVPSTTTLASPPEGLQPVPSTTTLASPPEGLQPVPSTTTLASPPEGLEPPAPPRGLLVLSAGAKGLVVLFLVLGIAQYVASGVVSVTTTSNARKTTQASSDLTAAHNTLAGRVQQYQQQISACPAELSCVQSADRELADAFAAFATELRGIAFPASAQAEAAELGDLADRIANSLQEQATAGSPEEYQRLTADNQELGNTFDQQEQALVNSLAA
jgi:hypothetical protein